MDGQVIYFEGRIAATVTPVGIAFSRWVGELGQGDPTWRFLSAAAACAYDVVTGCLRGPYSEDLAITYARSRCRRRRSLPPWTRRSRPHLSGRDGSQVLMSRGNKRSYGTGSVFVQAGSYYGKWRIGGVQVKRKLGPIKGPDAPDGLTRKGAEKRLRELIAAVAPPPPSGAIDIAGAGRFYLDHLEHVMQRKRTTIQDYRIMLDRHLIPFFGTVPIATIAPGKVADYMTAKRREGLAPNTVKNHVNFLHALFKFAVRREWAPRNPVDFVDRPPTPSADPDIRFLDREELEALLRAAGDDLLGPTDRALWLTAAMTGLRQGELAALRWRDVDWTARLVRVRRSFSRGQWTTPKSRRSVRAVPMPDRVAAELERHFGRSYYRHDDDLVFAHPESGRPYDASKMRQRFKEALKRAGLRPLRFHDLRHTYGTLMAAAGAPLRTLQGWMGHRDYKPTEIYADFAPDPSQGAAWAERAFGAPTELAAPDDTSSGPIHGTLTARSQGDIPSSGDLPSDASAGDGPGRPESQR